MDNTDVNVVYSVQHQLPLVMYIGQYFFFTGLSAGSFVISVIATLLGRKEFKPIGKITALLAPILLIIAPLNLILDLEQPLRFWHLFVFYNWTSPITYGSFLLTAYPVMGVIYAIMVYTNRQKAAKILGILGIPLAISVHGYTGFILALAKARALWNTAAMPTIFLVSAMVSGIGLVVIIAAARWKWFDKAATVEQREKDKRLIIQLAQFMAYIIMLDLFLILSDILVLLTAHSDAYQAGMLILTGNFAPLFLGVEIFLGSLVPMVLVLGPTRKSMKAIVIASILVNIGVYAMRFVMVIGGQSIPLS
ncbi:MAG: NrfD/PsrC family molybdoenzyme membrane anchor subunit [Thermoleophilia bacterium]|jgi:Ni/Fe-hydrogenase subunit HybB-like protein|nr:polysulfide reductase NrfD [Actinomycetota bacterium]MDA8166189.1 polysulfide reductase NrfD [Actinomycetota bacterium]